MSPVSYDEQSRTWLLSAYSSSYGIALMGEASLPRHLYWGAPTDHATLAAFADATETIAGVWATWGDEEPLEYTAWGGRRYDEPSLKVDFADGTRAIEWRVIDAVVEAKGRSSTLAIILADTHFPLRVALFYRVFDDSDVIERWARLTHTGVDGPITVRQAMSANWWAPDREGWNLTYLHGTWAYETQPATTSLGPNKLVLESRRGTTSHEHQPFFALHNQTGTSEKDGEVWSGQLAWSGSWKVVVETNPSGRVHVSGGWTDFDAPLELAPGADLVLPVFAGCYTNGGLGAMSRAWHHYERNHVLAGPNRDGGSPSFPTSASPAASAGASLPALRPVLYNSWEATNFNVSEQGQARLAERAADLGVELFVVDDGWFKGRRDDHAGLGDWTVDTTKFPNGLGALVDQVNSLGMKFGIWVEPEMVNPDSDLYRAHPDWVFHFENRVRSEQRNQLVLNLARGDVAEWLYQTLDRLLSEYNISFLKWDMNRQVSEPGWPGETGRNPERSWVDYTRHLYAVLDRLRQAHPDVELESCSGGGGRVDLGMLSRAQQVWTSDNTDAWDRTVIQEGFSLAHTAMAMMAWVTDNPNPLTRRRLPLSYRFHVAMTGSLGIGGDLMSWDDEEMAEARRLVDVYKQVRPVVQYGHLYRLASVRHGDVSAVEFISNDEHDVVVVAWTGQRRFRPTFSRIPLQGLDPEAFYRDMGTGQELSGRTLSQLGVAGPEGYDFASKLLRFSRVDK